MDYLRTICGPRIICGPTQELKALEPMTGMALATPQIKNLIGRMRKNKRAACAARTLKKLLAILGKITL